MSCSDPLCGAFKGKNRVTGQNEHLSNLKTKSWKRFQNKMKVFDPKKYHPFTKQKAGGKTIVNNGIAFFER